MGETDYICGSAGSHPPSRYINGEGYAYYQACCNGETKTVQEHQLVAILDGASPEKVFSNGEYEVHHEWSAGNGSVLSDLLKQFNFPANLNLLESGEHTVVTNGRRDYG